MECPLANFPDINTRTLGLAYKELAPRSACKSSGTVQLEILSGMEAAFQVEETLDRGVDEGESLQT
jgi:hypothetical protein